MCDEWMPHLRYPLAKEDFASLPRNPSYKYEYIDGTAILSPSPRHFHAELDLAAFQPGPFAADAIHLRPLQPGDRKPLESTFTWSFRTMQPFGSLDDEMRAKAARACLEKTWSGGDGPWVEQASFVAALAENDRPIGAILITLLPGGDISDWNSFYWVNAPAGDLVERADAQPHITWVFVAPSYAKSGVGSALLNASAAALRRLGYTSLWTTFLEANVSSLLWHWRNGFRLARYPGSTRGMTAGNG